MTTSGILVLTAYLLLPLVLGFALPARLRPLLVLGGLAILGNWAWQVFGKPVNADMPVWAAALLGLFGSFVLFLVCSGLAVTGAWAGRRVRGTGTTTPPTVSG